MRPIAVLSIVTALAFVAACGSNEEAPSPASRTPAEQRAIDSTIGASKLPGAHGVQGALRASDSAAARAARLDSVASAP